MKAALVSFWIGMLLLAGCAAQRTEHPLTDPAAFPRYVIVTLRNAPAPAPPRPGSTVRTYGAAARYSVNPAVRSIVKSLAERYDLREAAAWPIELIGVHCVVFEHASDKHAETLAQLRRDPRVESAQPLQTFSTLGGAASDPYRALQHNLDAMHIERAHAYSRGEGVRIAIVDTGVDARHPDLVGRVVQQENLVDARKPGSTAERHGTAVAGVIGASAGNREGIVGVAPRADLYALRACWPAADDGARAMCSTFTLAKAIAAAIDADVHIVNLSLAGPEDPLLTRIVHAGLRKGVVFVGATAESPPHARFPISIDGVIAVSDSTHRAGADAAVFAPGREVLTLTPGGRYDFLSGSSLAAASVSGGVALLLAREPSLTSTRARDLLIRSSVDRARNDPDATPSIDLSAALMLLTPEAHP